MTEAEILSNAIQASEAATAILSLFFAIVSAYVVGLYLFLHQAPFALRLIAFALLTVSMVALGMLALNIQHAGEGMHTAWMKLPEKATGMEMLGPPIVVQSLFLEFRTVATWVGWVLEGAVFFALAYLTFIYRWPRRSPQP